MPLRAHAAAASSSEGAQIRILDGRADVEGRSAPVLERPRKRRSHSACADRRKRGQPCGRVDEPALWWTVARGRRGTAPTAGRQALAG